MIPFVTNYAKAYSQLEEKAMTIYKLSGMSLDEIIAKLAKGYEFVPPKQIEATWETFTEVKNNTVCGDGVKIQHKRCSNCKQPMGLTEECFCGKCGAKIKAAMVEQRGDSI